MTIAISDAREYCEKCENYSVLWKDVHKRHLLIFSKFLYTEKKCYYCGHEKGKIERERDEKLSKILT